MVPDARTAIAINIRVPKYFNATAKHVVLCPVGFMSGWAYVRLGFFPTRGMWLGLLLLMLWSLVRDRVSVYSV